MSELPPYVVVGEWRDDEWYDAWVKAEMNGILSPAQRCLLHDYPRPRSHPYGYDAWQRAVPFGKVMVFPSEEAHDAWFAQPRS
jgi:hypothetical protein